MKLFAAVLLSTFLVTQLHAADQKVYKVFDSKYRLEGYWVDKGDEIVIYDRNWKIKGYIHKKEDSLERFDDKWKRKGFVERECKPL